MLTIQHPWRAVFAAAVVGAWLGSEARHAKPAVEHQPRPSTIRSRAFDALISTAGVIALRIVREVAFRHASAFARDWSERAFGQKNADDRTWRPSAS